MTDFATRLNEMLSQPVVPWTILGVIVVGVLLGQVQKHVPDDPIERMKRLFGVPNIPHGLALFIAVLWGALLLVLFVGLVTLLYEIVWGMAAPVSREGEGDFRFLLAKITALTAVLGALVALPFTALRLKLTDEQNLTAREGQITERINKAVEGLGATKQVKRQRRNKHGVLLFEDRDTGELTNLSTKENDEEHIDTKKPIFEEVTQANLEVRVGAVYALERISQDSLRDHPRIMEILATYIRENSPIEKGSVNHERGIAERTRADIAAAITVIGRRTHAQRLEDAKNELGFIDLEECDLRGLYVKRLNFEGISFGASKLSTSHFEGTSFSKCNLTDSDFSETGLIQCDLSKCNASYANFEKTHCYGISFRLSNLFKTKFVGAELRPSPAYGAATDFYGANVVGAKMNANSMVDAINAAPLFLDRTTLKTSVERSYLPEVQSQIANLWSELESLEHIGLYNESDEYSEDYEYLSKTAWQTWLETNCYTS